VVPGRRFKLLEVKLLEALCLVAGLALVGSFVAGAASPIRQLTNTSAANLRPAWSPDGQRIAFQSNRDGPYHIYLMNADGSTAQQLSSGDRDDRHPAWSPDAKQIAVDSGDALHREIWVIDVATRARTQITKLGAITSFPSWSPDGKRISFFLYQAGAMDLWTVTPTGGGAARLTTGLASEANLQCTFACHSAVWSPDNSRIAFSDGDLARVILMTLASGAQTTISPAGERSHFPIFLPDGQIVYVSEHVSPDQSWTDLWSVSPDRGDQRSEVTTNVQAQGPFELSADGKELLFASPRTGNFEIYSVTLNEAGKAALATKPDHTVPAQTRIAPIPEDGLARWRPWIVGVGALVLLAGGIRLRSRKRDRRS
jgi:Tol biopolymer transport system component